MSRRVGSAIVRIASVLVPRNRRQEWLEEWRGELSALAVAQTTSTPGLPSTIGFSLGALPHALWMRTEGWTVDSVIQDVKYWLRVLRRSPGFTIATVVTLALGIGANASIFALVNGLVLRAPAGIEQPDRLVQVARSYESAPRWDNFSWPAMELIASEADAFSGVMGFTTRSFVLGRGTDTERVIGQLVTGNYFSVLGIQPHLGRLIQPDDDVSPGNHPVIVISHGLWQRRFGGDPRIVGQSIQVAATPYVVLGVAPARFAGVETVGSPPQVWVPTMQMAGLFGRAPFDEWGHSWISVVARLNDGVTIEAARSSMDVVSTQLREATPANQDMLVLLAQGVGLSPDEHRQARQIAAILLLIVGLVLFLTCTSVANLQLARASARRTEVAVRMALGAARPRLVRQTVTETMLLAGAATALALPMVMAADRFLPAVFPYTLAVPLDPDGRVFGFLVLTGLLAGLLFGAAPAWVTSRRSPITALKEVTSSGGRSRTRLRDGLVVAQLGLSLGLVASTALLGRSVLNASNAQPGFQPRGLVAGVVDLEPTGRYDEEQGLRLYRRLVEEAEAIPGVRSATIANSMPLVGGHARSSVQPLERPEVSYEAEFIVVGPDYFETMGIPVVQGRALGGFDDEPEPVVVVNEALAAMFWPGEDPIGKELAGDPVRRVVGVVGDVQMRSLRSRARPAVYYPISQRYWTWMAVHVSGESGIPPTIQSVRALVAGIDPELPVTAVVDLQAALTDSMAETRTIGMLVAGFAVLALTLAIVGLYGLVSYGASQRVREIGIRMALGARPESLVRLVLTRGLVISLLGVMVGLVVALGLGRALESLLFGVAPGSATIIGASAAALMLVAALAAWLPARRASRVDAAVSLREA